MINMLEEWQKKKDIPFSPAPPKEEQINTILQEIDNKLKVKYMPEAVADSFAKQALSIAEKGSLEALNAILMAVNSYPDKSVPVPEDISKLQEEIHQKLKILVDGKIDGFETSKRMSNSIIKHLGTKTIKQCQDINKLTEYSEHLDYTIHNSGKEEK
jgi:predicted transcriptional regulator